MSFYISPEITAHGGLGLQKIFNQSIKLTKANVKATVAIFRTIGRFRSVSVIKAFGQTIDYIYISSYTCNESNVRIRKEQQQKTKQNKNKQTKIKRKKKHKGALAD